jgi:hypothetical protein
MSRFVHGAFGLAASVGMAWGCDTQAFSCQTDEQCRRGAVDGVCQSSGYCSFGDNACPSGQRYSKLSGDGLSGTCVDNSPTDATDTLDTESSSATTAVDGSDGTISDTMDDSTVGDELETLRDSTTSDSGDPIPLPVCADYNLGSAMGDIVAEGSTASAAHEWRSDCGGGQSPDEVFRWVAPETGTYSFSLEHSTFNTVLSLVETCDGPELSCNNDDGPGGYWSRIDHTVMAGQELIIVVDGYYDQGNYRLSIVRN